MAAYATDDDVLALFIDRPEPNEKRQARLSSLLQTATDELNGELGGLDFFRHPTSGERTWVVDGSGKQLLHVHRGIASLSAVEVSLDSGLSFVAVDPSHWELRWDAFSNDEPPDGEPWFHLRMKPFSTFGAFPLGASTVRLTGASGWPRIPSPAIEGVAERARQVAYSDGSYQGSASSDESYGTPTMTTRWPDVVWKFLSRERARFYACEA